MRAMVIIISNDEKVTYQVREIMKSSYILRGTVNGTGDPNLKSADQSRVADVWSRFNSAF